MQAHRRGDASTYRQMSRTSPCFSPTSHFGRDRRDARVAGALLTAGRLAPIFRDPFPIAYSNRSRLSNCALLLGPVSFSHSDARPLYPRYRVSPLAAPSHALRLTEARARRPRSAGDPFGREVHLHTAANSSFGIRMISRDFRNFI